MVDGIVDRQAVGGELRYASNQVSAFSLIDYDLSYERLNIATFNGSWVTEGGTNFTWLLDRRRTPSLQTTNGLSATGFNSVKEALRVISARELRQYARALTAESDLIQVGLTYPLTRRWQLGGELSFSHVSGTDAAGIQPAVPGIGDVWSYTARVIGSNILIRNHTLTIQATYTDYPAFQGQSLFLNSLARFGSAWQLDTSLTTYHQLDDNDVRLVRLTPKARLAYRLRNSMTLEAEVGLENTFTSGPNQEETILRPFSFIGYIWEF